MVTMSRVYEVIRGDEKVVSNDDEKQVSPCDNKILTLEKLSKIENYFKKQGT